MQKFLFIPCYLVSVQGVTERSEGVFSSAFRKFKSLIFEGGKRALFAYFFLLEEYPFGAKSKSPRKVKIRQPKDF